MAKKDASSYLDSIGSGREAVGYDGPQVGKDREEEVAADDNWKGDTRDPIGRAAFISMKKKRLARKLRRIAAEVEALDAEYKDEVEKMADEIDDEVKDEEKQDYLTKSEKEDELDKEEKQDPMGYEMGTDPDFDTVTSELSTENHPLEKDPLTEDPEANASSQKGDDEWIEIGPGSFDDPRNAIGKAAHK